MERINGGFYLKARQVKDSAIFKSPPHVREIWDWILMNANYADRANLNRGQLITSYDMIIEDLSWYVGFRKESYKKHQCETAMKTLTKLGMITTTKTIRGMIITVCNYDKYQSPKNYDSHSESRDDNRDDSDTITALLQKKVIINKEEENTLSDFPAGKDQVDQFENPKSNPAPHGAGNTRKRPFVQDEFDRFWDAFGHKEGKAKAIASWKAIKGMDDDLVGKIIDGAKRYAIKRQGILAKGGTPKMAQGWLTDRRWEDEDVLTSSYKPQSGCDYFVRGICKNPPENCKSCGSWQEAR